MHGSSLIKTFQKVRRGEQKLHFSLREYMKFEKINEQKISQFRELFYFCENVCMMGKEIASAGKRQNLASYINVYKRVCQYGR
jgi:hypothetical protein